METNKAKAAFFYVSEEMQDKGYFTNQLPALFPLLRVFELVTNSNLYEWKGISRGMQIPTNVWKNEIVGEFVRRDYDDSFYDPLSDNEIRLLDRLIKIVDDSRDGDMSILGQDFDLKDGFAQTVDNLYVAYTQSK